jgi:hypothetical protein
MAMIVLKLPQRRRRQARERGAAIFVVVLALTLLTGVGIWSMRSAALVDQASGHARAAMQGQYLAEMGLITASTLLAIPGYARKADSIALGKDPLRPTPDACRGTVATSYCKVWEVQDIQDRPERLRCFQRHQRGQLQRSAGSHLDRRAVCGRNDRRTAGLHSGIGRGVHRIQTRRPEFDRRLTTDRELGCGNSE